MQAVNATFVFPDDGTYCRNYMGPGYPDKTFVLVGKDTPMSLTNKNMSDSSNTYKDTNLIIGGVDMPVGNIPSDGTYLGVDENGTLRFMDPSQVNVWGMRFVNSNYVGSVHNGLPDTPFLTVSDALASLPSVGGIINIIEGNYTENITMKTNVSIIVSNGDTVITGDMVVENAGSSFRLKDINLTGNLTITSNAALGVVLENITANNVYISVNVPDVNTDNSYVCIVRNSKFASLNVSTQTILLDKSYISGQANIYASEIELYMTAVESGLITHKYGSASSTVKLQWSKILTLDCNDAILTRDLMSYSASTLNNVTENIATQGALGMYKNNVRVGNMASLEGSRNTIIGSVPNTPITAIGQTIIGHHASRPTGNNTLYISPDVETIIAPGLQGMSSGVPMIYNTETGEMNYQHEGPMLMKGINDISVGDSLQVLDELRPRSFTWNENNTNDVGLLADEVPEEFAAYAPDGVTKVSVKYLSLIPHLLKTLKYMRAEIIDLKNKLRESKSTLSMIKKK